MTLNIHNRVAVGWLAGGGEEVLIGQVWEAVGVVLSSLLHLSIYLHTPYQPLTFLAAARLAD